MNVEKWQVCSSACSFENQHYTIMDSLATCTSKIVKDLHKDRKIPLVLMIALTSIFWMQD